MRSARSHCCERKDLHRNRDRWAHALLVEELRRVSAEAKKDANELFRRMCFNALISNVDDHPRNHALIAKTRDWGLAPAYDLTPQPLISLEGRDLAMICGDQGRIANKTNLLSQSARFLLSHNEASAIAAAMEDQVRNSWYEVGYAEPAYRKKTASGSRARSPIPALILNASNRSMTTDPADPLIAPNLLRKRRNF